MANDVATLQATGRRRARVLDRLTASFARELGRVYRDLERRLGQLVRDAFDPTNSSRRTATATAVYAGQLRRQLRDVLRESGYDSLVETAAGRSLERVLRELTATGVGRQVVRFLPARREAMLVKLTALQQLAQMDLAGQGDVVAASLWRSLVQGLFSNRPVVDVVQDLADALDMTEREVRTLYDTTVSTYMRQTEAVLAGDDPTQPFFYSGPIDALLRPFCLKHVGKVYTRKAIDKMDNGQLPNVFLTGGGYNCRHTWLSVPVDTPVGELANTGMRPAEVVAELARVKDLKPPTRTRT